MNDLAALQDVLRPGAHLRLITADAVYQCTFKRLFNIEGQMFILDTDSTLHNMTNIISMEISYE